MQYYFGTEQTLLFILYFLEGKNNTSFCFKLAKARAPEIIIRTLHRRSMIRYLPCLDSEFREDKKA